MKRTLLSITIFAMISAGAAAQAPATSTVPAQVHQVGRIRIFYHTEGRDAVNAADANANHIPDQVEDVLTQTLAAQTMFVEVLGFPDPFLTERFRSAKFL